MAEIYLDNSATTPVLPQVAAYATELMVSQYGNPSSLHRKGFLAQQVVDKARGQIAAVLGCTPEELLFTSGGTEANNLAILGLAQVHRRKGGKFILNGAEHSSVLACQKPLEQMGFVVEIIPPLPSGAPNAAAMVAAITPDTILLSAMLVNSEVGSLCDIAALAAAAKAKNPKLCMHCDGVQGFGRIPLLPKKWGIDLVSISGHKLHAPKGVGALYIAKGLRILPLLYGGGQEKQLRPGTESVPLIGAFGLAAQLIFAQSVSMQANFLALKTHFVNKLKTMSGLCINSPDNAVPYIMNLSIPGLRSEILIHFLEQQQVYLSSGSACAKGAKSHVLTAMGLDAAHIDSALRVSLSIHNTIDHLDQLLHLLSLAQKKLAR